MRDSPFDGPDDRGIDPADERFLCICRYASEHGVNSLNREQLETLADYASARIQDMDAPPLPVPFPFTSEVQ